MTLEQQDKQYVLQTYARDYTNFVKGVGSTLYDENGQHLVCRPFSISDHELILAVVVPDKQTRYRRSTNTAINHITQTWKEFWE
jgi:hypothetical protein